jgi:dienelactone hydrolase
MHRRCSIPVGDTEVEADLVVPEAVLGVVLFAHGSGSSRLSPRNRYVATELHRAGLGTALVDLFTPEEEALDLETGELRFDIDFLSARLIAIIDWLIENAWPTTGHALGLFGASTGAAGALVAAAARPASVTAIVSRGGRPDLAGEILEVVRQPVLLIVGERDPVVLQLNREAADRLAGETRLEVVPGASHLFEEPGALEQVAQLAREWFVRHLPLAPTSGSTDVRA